MDNVIEKKRLDFQRMKIEVFEILYKRNRLHLCSIGKEQCVN